jgi:predicted ATPase
MNIASISVTGLFGLFNHKIHLRTKQRITILHGPNGVGKTTILRMLKALCSFEFNNLAKFEFNNFTVGFQDGRELKILKVPAVGANSRELKFLLGSAGQVGEVIHTYRKLIDESMDERKLRQLLGTPVGSIEDIIPELDQVGPRSWRVIPTGETIDLEEVVNKYSDRLPVRSTAFLRQSAPDVLKLLLKENKVYLIETQRLIAQSEASATQHDIIRWPNNYARPSRDRTPPGEGSAVAEISHDLTRRIAEALQLSGRIATKLDAQFAYKLITGSVSEIGESEIREKYARYKNFNNSLASAGVFESQYIHDLPTKVLESGDKRALSLYLHDVEEKLRPFGDLLNKVLLFVSLINGRFKHKTLRIEKDRGLHFLSSRGDEILGASLSSGEQHELILMYTLLFRVPSASLIAIDEPEISLHVTWQQKFLDDLKSMSETADLDFVIATHSPSIINGRLDLTVELDS